MRVKKNNEINELNEQVKEYTDLYNQARGAQMELQVFKLRQLDIEKLREKNKNLEEQNLKLKDQNELLIEDQGKLKDFEKMKNYFLEETKKEKTAHKVTQLELKKQSG